MEYRTVLETLRRVQEVLTEDTRASSRRAFRIIVKLIRYMEDGEEHL